MFENIPEVDLEMARYGDYVDVWSFVNVDWTPDTFELAIRQNWNTDPALISIASGSGIGVTSGPSDLRTILTVELSHLDLKDLPHTSLPTESSFFVYDLRRITQNNEFIILRGSIELVPGSTK